jgi:deoxyribodipyrimidine photolyase
MPVVWLLRYTNRTSNLKSALKQIAFIIIIMDIQVDFFRWQVPDLKEYLQHRGITCHLNRKHELVKLCELAQELDLEKIFVQFEAIISLFQSHFFSK